MENLDHKYKKSSFYKIPDDYFENLPMEIMSKKPVESSSNNSHYITFLKFAIPCVLIYVLAINIMDSHTNSGTELNWTEISEVEIISYFESENLSEFEIIKNIESEESLKKYLKNFSIEEEFALHQDIINPNEWLEISNFDD